MVEKRLLKNSETTLPKGTELPSDYLKLIGDVLNKNFADVLKDLSAEAKDPSFLASGKIFLDEVVLTVSLSFSDRLAAMSCHASMDYDPKASSPKLEELLGVCVDSIGSFWEQVLNQKSRDYKKNIDHILNKPLADFEGLPLQWTEYKFNKKRVYLMVNGMNPAMEKATDEWLEANDPELKKKEEEEEKDREDMIVVGPKGGKGK